MLGLNALRLEGGLILAVPATEAVKERTLAMTRGEAAAGLRLGVAVAPPRVARRMRRAVGLPEREGLLVRAVEAGGPAGSAGITALVNGYNATLFGGIQQAGYRVIPLDTFNFLREISATPSLYGFSNATTPA